MSNIHPFAFSVALTLLLAACSGPDRVSLGRTDGGAGQQEVGASDFDAAAVASCVSDQDCTGGLRCGYPVTDLCAATGVCIESNCSGAGTSCLSPGGMCGCNGQSIEPVKVITQTDPSGGGSMIIQYASAPSSGRVGPCSLLPNPPADAQTP